MHKMIKVAFGVAVAICIAETAFRVGMWYGEGLATGMIAKKLDHITEHEVMEVVERVGFNPSRNLNDYAFVEGIKKAYKVK